MEEYDIDFLAIKWKTIRESFAIKWKSLDDTSTEEVRDNSHTYTKHSLHYLLKFERHFLILICIK